MTFSHTEVVLMACNFLSGQNSMMSDKDVSLPEGDKRPNETS